MATFHYQGNGGRFIVERADSVMVRDGCLVFVHDNEIVKAVPAGDWSQLRKVDDRCDPHVVDTGMQFRRQPVYLKSTEDDKLDKRNVEQFTQHVQDYIDDKHFGE
jgi:hypothetical protein